MSFDVQTPDLSIPQKTLKSQSAKVLFLCMTKMEELAKTYAPVDTGLLKNRINLEPKQVGATEYELSDGVSYGIHMEYGTKPHWVPIEPLKDWSRRVLGDEGAAYAVQKKIAAQGVQAQPFFRPAFDEVKFKWLGVFQNQLFGKA